MWRNLALDSQKHSITTATGSLIHASLIEHIKDLVSVAKSYSFTTMASGLAAELYYEEKVTALIGPSCTYALDPVARLAAFWNIPIITGALMFSYP